MMGDEVGGDGPSSNFLLDNHFPWPGFSNSDHSGGTGSTDQDKINGKKIIDSSSNSPTPAPTPTATTATPSSVVAVGQKRGRNGAPPKSSTGKGAGSSGGGGGGVGSGGGGESDHEIHIWTERERRKKMRNMFSNLHALLPQLPAKADKSTIVDEAVNYIKTLQHTLQKLQKQRLEMLRGAPLTSTTTVEYEPSVVASTAPTFNSREAFLADQGSSSKNNSAMTNMNFPPNPLSVPCIPATFQTWSSPNVVLSVNGDDAQISICAPKKPGLFSTVCYVLEKHKLEVVTAQVSSDYYRSMFMIHAHANGACDQFPEALPVEEIYKLAVGEMIFWLSS